MSATDIISQLQTKLVIKNTRQELKPYEVEELFGPGFNAQYPPYTDDPEDDYIDVPNAVDTKYTTFRVFSLPKGKKAGSNSLPFPNESALKEQEDEEKAKERERSADEVAADVGTEAGEESGAEAGAKAGEESAMADVGETGDSMSTPYGASGIGNVGLGSLGMGDEEEQKTASEIGRIYELKKIYARLTSLELYLADESSGELNEVRQYISQGIELFEIISANFDSYKDRLDEIIIMYYKFILEVYNTVKNFYKKEASSGDQ